MIEKFEIKPPKQKLEEKEPEIKTWEDEGGAIESPKEKPEEMLVEIPETIIEEERVKKSWREILMQAKEEFPEDIQRIIEKDSQGGKLKLVEYHKLDHFAKLWFREAFGMRIKKKIKALEPVKKDENPQTVEEEVAEQKRETEEQKKKKSEEKIKKIEEKKKPILKQLAHQKRDRMEKLHRALRNLDLGESVKEFEDTTRRVVYFDEEEQQYFVEENGERKNIGIGDIVSDYAWAIKYFPDSRMTDPAAYRILSKKILTNETRRDLEGFYDKELKTQKPNLGRAEFDLQRWEKNFDKLEMSPKIVQGGIAGQIAEIEVREWLNRVSLNNGLNFLVLRADIQEDSEYKYDFKIRVKYKNRGIKIDSNSTDIQPVTKLGFQLKTSLGERPQEYLLKFGKNKKRGQQERVDKIVLISIKTSQFLSSFKTWIEAGEPSGGPEQFLLPELKKTILKAVTEKLVDIPQEIFDKIE
ncbi:MAG: hypothetical protein COU27_02390 [Candidatus Levybacteria bacterium CG10_big_fil_rev_8_21_14_0_10_36_7]|nr:MAG: hypothetical protein COU27_02390 [Candidatus Levybacteria bacterium CG10_big_fil_rev_8_21_14_0_10_36_7]